MLIVKVYGQYRWSTSMVVNVNGKCRWSKSRSMLMVKVQGSMVNVDSHIVKSKSETKSI